MSEISQEYSEDKDIALYDDNMHDSDGFATQSEEEYDDRTREGPIDIDGHNGDGQSVSSSSDTGERYKVSSVVDLDPEIQRSKVCQRKIYFIPYLPRHSRCVACAFFEPTDPARTSVGPAACSFLLKLGNNHAVQGKRFRKSVVPSLSYSDRYTHLIANSLIIIHMLNTVRLH
jgi:hypothetical protein